MNSFQNSEAIELKLDLNPTYISTASKTATNIAENMNFSNSKVDDIKNAVSEAVTFIINNSDVRCSSTNDDNKNFKISFSSDNSNSLNVEINSLGKKDSPFELALGSIRDYMDDVKFDYLDNSNLIIKMTKKF